MEKKFRLRNTLSALFVFMVIVSVMTLQAFATTVTVLDGKVSIADSANSISASGNTATIQAKGSLFSQKTNNVTIKNASDSKANLSFDYSAESAVSFTIAGASANASGSYSVTLEAGGTLAISIKSNKGLSGTTATLTLSNISWVAVAESSNVTVEFDSAHGSVTVAGAAVTSGTTQNVSGTTGITLVATPASGVTFLGWVDDDGKILKTAASYTLIPASDMTVKAAFAQNGGAPWFGVGAAAQKSASSGILGLGKLYYYAVGTSYLFDDLNAATQFAASESSNKYIVLMNNATLPAGDYTIPAGVTLLVPFDADNTLYTTDVIAASEEGYAKPTAVYRTLTMADGANITINGDMSLSNKLSASQPNHGAAKGALSRVNMLSGSTITVDNGGRLFSYGHIVGTGAVTVKSGGTVYEPFQMMDYRGGDCTTAMLGNEQRVLPMSQYYVQNIEVPLTLEPGATELCLVGVAVTGIGVQGSDIPFIGRAEGKIGMFEITSGTLTKDYIESEDRLKFTLDGEVSMQSLALSMQLSAFGGTKTIDSADYNLPINNNITVEIIGGSVDITQDIAMLPGTELIVAEGVTCNLESGRNVYVYDQDEWGTYCGHLNKTFCPCPYAPGRLKDRTDADLVDAKVQIDGIVKAKAGFVYTTDSGANVFSVAAGVVETTAGSDTLTYQVTQTNTEVGEWNEIPITPAKLKNADGTYIQTATDTYYYEDGVWKCTYHTAGEEATCTTAQTCTVCGAELVAALGHNHVGVVTAPTCEAEGYTTYTCACGDSYVDNYVAALGHKHTAAVTAPTCTDKGYTTYTCACGDSYVDNYVAALGHKYNATVTPPSCVSDGYTTYTCSVCGDTYVADTVAAKGHTNGTPVIENKVDSDCTNDGSYELAVYCTVCGEELSRETKTISATGHDMQQTATKVEPGCENPGKEAIFTCANGCGHTEGGEAIPAKGHTPGAEATCTTAQTCTVCGAELVAALGHKYNATVTPPSCVSDGYTTYTCSVCGDSYVDSHVDALGHTEETVIENKVDSDCINAGSYDTVVRCTTCGEELSRKTTVTPALGHTPGAEATCTTAQTCTVCGAELAPALGHKYNATVTDPDCVNDGYTTHTCTVCGDSYVDSHVDALGHTEETDAAVAPTCTATGLTEGKHCTVCGEATVAQETVDALGHTEVTDEAVAPTCTATGLTEGKHCTVCGTVTVAQTEVPALDHTPGAEVTCTTTQTCTVCGVELAPALGHKYNATVTPPSCEAEGYTTYTCSVCGDSYVDSHVDALGHTEETVIENKVDSDCINAGSYDTVVRCTTCGAETSRENIIIPATGHDMQQTAAKVNPDCENPGKEAIFTCANGCGHTEGGEAIPALGHTPGAEATCTTAQTCTVCGAELVAALGHKYNATVTPPSCVSDGYTTYTCSVCGDNYVDSHVDALGHTEETVIENKVDSDCTNTGSYDTVVRCTTCGEELSRKTTVTPALGHTAGEAATCTTAQTCTVCGAELVAALGHNHVGVVTAPTCEAEGYTTYTCSCGDSYKADTVPAKGHDYEVSYLWTGLDEEPAMAMFAMRSSGVSCTAVGVCRTEDCGHEETATAEVTSDVTTKPTYSTEGVTKHSAVFNVEWAAPQNKNSTTVVATVNGNKYTRLDQAINAATESGAVVVLSSAVEGEVPVNVGTSIDSGEYELNISTAQCSKTVTDDEGVITVVEDHSAGEAVVENEVAATCTTDGSYESVVKCTACGEELSRAIVTVPAKGHSAGEAKSENSVAPTCTTDGSYESVVKCTACGAELSRETVVVPATGHSDDCGHGTGGTTTGGTTTGGTTTGGTTTGGTTTGGTTTGGGETGGTTTGGTTTGGTTTGGTTTGGTTTGGTTTGGTTTGGSTTGGSTTGGTTTGGTTTGGTTTGGTTTGGTTTGGTTTGGGETGGTTTGGGETGGTTTDGPGTGGTTYIPGDANLDGTVDSTDAVMILQKLAGYEVQGFHEDAADFDGNGMADSSDAVGILQKLAGY